MQELLQGLSAEVTAISMVFPELLLLVISVLWLVPRLFGKEPKGYFWLYFAAVVVIGLLLFRFFSVWDNQFAFYQTVQFRNSDRWFYLLAIVFALVPLLAFRPQSFSLAKNSPEVLFFYLSAIAGALFAILANNWIVLYLAIEILSFSSYFLAAQKRDKNSAEAGLKYLLQGATASAIMLYGISWLYGMAGGLQWDSLTYLENLQQASPVTVFLVFGLISGGLFFKLSVFPMHGWVSNVYETASMPVVAFLSVVPKVAMLAVFWHILPSFYDVIPQLYIYLGWVAMLGITIGNLLALGQQKTMRMLAYSSVSQAGYLLLPLLSGSDLAFNTLLVYIVVYGAATYSLFIILESQGWKDFTFENFAGMGKTHLLPTIAMLVCLMSLVGLPPTLGLIGKAGLFLVLMEGFQETKSLFFFWVGAVALLNAAVALYYYLQIPYQAYFKQASKAEMPEVKPWIIGEGIAYILVGVLIFGFVILVFI